MAVVRARRDDLDLFSMRVVNHPQCANGSRMRSRRLEPRKASPHAMPLASIEHHHNIAHRRMPPERKGSVCGLLRCDHLPQEEISDDLEEFLDRRLHLWRDRMPLSLTLEGKHHRPTSLSPKLHPPRPAEREGPFRMRSERSPLPPLLS